MSTRKQIKVAKKNLKKAPATNKRKEEKNRKRK